MAMFTIVIAQNTPRQLLGPSDAYRDVVVALFNVSVALSESRIEATAEGATLSTASGNSLVVRFTLAPGKELWAITSTAAGATIGVIATDVPCCDCGSPYRDSVDNSTGVI